MAIFKLQDGTSFYQWDRKRVLMVIDHRIDEVHFTNSTLDQAIVKEVYEKDGNRLVDVPAYLLECGCNITAYAYIQHENKEFTLTHEVFRVNARKKPDDYVEEEEQERWSELDARITDLERNGGVSTDIVERVGKNADDIKKLQNETAKKKDIPTTLPASDVFDWAKQPEKPQYTAAEVGADATGTASAAVSGHNTATNAHSDIRLLITNLTTLVNNLLDADDETLNQTSEIVEYIKDNRDLIEQITTGKVSTSDIIDDLNTSASNKPLSANQGVVLKGLIDTLQAAVNAIAIPSKMSQLENDAGFITAAVSTLTNYYTKTVLDGLLTQMETEAAKNAASGVSAHNVAADSHNDIRLLVEGLNTRLNALANSTDTDLDQMAELVAYIKDNRGLIEQVTTGKVNVTDIVDNLTTNVANRPLSAAQGVVLKTLIDALQSSQNTHAGNATVHITEEERTAWNSKAEEDHDHDGVYADADHEHSDYFPKAGGTVTGDTYFLKNVWADEGLSVGFTQDEGVESHSGMYAISLGMTDAAELEAALPWILFAKRPTLQYIKDTEKFLIVSGGSIEIDGRDGTAIKNLVDPTEDGDAVPKWYVDQMKGGGTADAVDWSNVQNKPFTTVGGDTLTWDGNTDGKVLVGEGFYKISDCVPTESELANGGKLIATSADGASEGVGFTQEYCTVYDGGVISIYMDMAVIISQPNTTYCEQKFSEAGVYFMCMEGQMYVSSLTINGYTGFTKEVIKQEVLPEALRFGESKTGGDTLTWDGNTDGLYTFGGDTPMFKVSDSTPSLSDFENGHTITMSNGTVLTETEDPIMEFMPGVLGAGSGAILICSVANTDLGGIVIEHTGIYLMNSPELGCTTSLTINGYTGFPSVTPLDEKYMPVLTSPSGKKFKITVDDTGILKATEV